MLRVTRVGVISMTTGGRVQHRSTVLVTGGTGGIGYHAARLLGSGGHEVVITGRSAERGEEAAATICRQAPTARVTFLQADHSTVGGNTVLATRVRSAFPHLDVLINNVGGLYESRGETTDGVEATLAMNVLGPFVLSQELLPLLAVNAPGRCINVVSAGFKLHKGDPFEDVQSISGFVGGDAYAQTKLLNLLITLAFARRYEATAVTINALHPGMAWTGMTQSMTPRTMPALWALWPFLRLVQRTGSPQKAGRRLTYLATAPQLATLTGTYFEGSAPRRLSRRELDVGTQDRAWQLAAELVDAAGARHGESVLD